MDSLYLFFYIAQLGALKFIAQTDETNSRELDLLLPLRDRKTDIPAFVGYFLKIESVKQMKKAIIYDDFSSNEA